MRSNRLGVVLRQGPGSAETAEDLVKPENHDQRSADQRKDHGQRQGDQGEGPKLGWGEFTRRAQPTFRGGVGTT